MKDQQAVTTSLRVAEGFEKQHKHVIEAIEAKIQSAENSAHYKTMFAEGVYQDSRNRTQKIYYMNRDGFAFIAFGFTGSKADEFKLKYIEAFNQMENHIKNQLDVSKLSPDLQMFHSIFKSLADQQLEFNYQKERQEKLENKVDGISDLIAMDVKDWRREVNAIIRKIAIKQGGFDKFKEIGNESYLTLEDKARCNLDIRLENRKKNMIAQGLGKTAVKKLNKLDIIEEDHRLKEIYISVVKNMAIKYGVWEEE